MNNQSARNQPLVMVVDDDPAVRLLISASLDAHGFDAAEFSDGESAVSHFVEIQPDIVVMDVLMPGMNGFETCMKIRQMPEGRFTPILILTGLDDADSIGQAYDAGATDFETKPIKPLLLAKRLQYLVGAKKTADELRNSERRFKSLTEHAPEAIIVFNYESGQILDVNRNASRLMKRDRESLMTMEIDELCAQSKSATAVSQNPLHRAIDQAIAGDVPAFFCEFDDAEGNLVWSEARLIRVPGAAEPLVRLSLIDISNERRLEREAAQLGRIVEESLNETYIFHADTLKFMTVNKGARDNLGYSSDELLELTPVDLKPLFTREAFQALIQPLRNRSTKRVQFATEHQRKDGSIYPVEADLQLTEYKGEPAFVANIVDVTEYRNTEAQLRQAQKMEAVGQLTGGIAHDFNNLLTVVIGNLQLLEESSTQGLEDKELIGDALASATRGADLTRRLLAFGRQQVLEPTITDVSVLAADMLQLLQRTLGESISVVLTSGEPSLLAKVDASQLENAVLNLAINARDAMPDGGRLKIETRAAIVGAGESPVAAEMAPGEYVVLSVSDTGEGIAPDLLSRVFDPFFTTKEIGKGSGLGLSMVYGFVKQSQGWVRIDSELGEGSCVELYFPRVQAAELSDSDPVASVKVLPAGRETILVVEDDTAVRSLATRMLGKLGYRVLEADGGPPALEILNSDEPIDLLFTDVVMPGMGGPELAEEARKCRPGLRVLFTTGFTDSAVFRAGVLDNTVNVLNKPYSRTTLAAAARGALDEEDGTQGQTEACS